MTTFTRAPRRLAGFFGTAFILAGSTMLAACEDSAVAPSVDTVSAIDSLVGMHPLRRVDTLPVPHVIQHANHDSGLPFGAIEIRRDSTFTRWTLQTVDERVLGGHYEYWRIDEGRLVFDANRIMLRVTGMNGSCQPFARLCDRTPVENLRDAELRLGGGVITLRSDWLPGYAEFQYEVAQIGASAGAYQLWKLMNATVPAESFQDGCALTSVPITVQGGSLLLGADGHYVRRTTKSGGCRPGEEVDSGRVYLARGELRFFSFDLRAEEAVLAADSIAGQFIADMTLSRQTGTFLYLRHVYRR